MFLEIQMWQGSLFHVLIVLAYISVASACKHRQLNEASKPDSASKEHEEINFEQWMKVRPDKETLAKRFAEDLANLSTVFNRPLGSQDKFYEFVQKSPAAGKSFSFVWPKISKAKAGVYRWPLLKKEGQLTVHRPPNEQKRALNCAAFPDSKAGEMILDEAVRLWQSEDPAQIGLGIALRTALETLDLYNASQNKLAVTLMVVEFRRTYMSQEPAGNYWHQDGGYIGTTLTLTGRGTDYVTSPEKYRPIEAGSAPRSINTSIESGDFKTARTGHYLFFAGNEFNKVDRMLDAVIHRSTPKEGQDRSTFIIRMNELEEKVTKEYCNSETAK